MQVASAEPLFLSADYDDKNGLWTIGPHLNIIMRSATNESSWEPGRRRRLIASAPITRRPKSIEKLALLK
jgi:hypothetical protein